MRSFSTLKLALTGTAALVALGLVIAQAQPAAGSATRVEEHKMIGASKCKGCHSSAETGDQYGKWESSPHAKAFEALASDRAKEIAKAKGIADPQKADECLKCHVTSHTVAADLLDSKGKWDDPKTIAMGVQCETCHGGGADHMKARMKAAMGGEKPEYKGLSADEITADVPAATCKKCHNEESPTFKDFCYHTATHKIAHLNPLKDHGEPKMGCDDPCHCKGECTHKCGG